MFPPSKSDAISSGMLAERPSPVDPRAVCPDAIVRGLPTELTVHRLIGLAAALVSSSALAQLPVEPHTDQLALLASDDPKLAANKKLVFDFWREGLQAHDVERATELLSEGYVEHDPNVPTGRAAFLRSVGQLPKQPVEPTVDELVAIVAERDLVVFSFRRELADLENEGQTYTTTWFEMFRVENGRIAEHWSSTLKE
jgi:predicted SnoaL-like aldol condensation-catalyzing enzyme